MCWRLWRSYRKLPSSCPNLFLLNHCSAQERKRRQVYRGEVHGQLPFDTKGMDEPVPSIEFSVSPAQTHGSESPYSLERSDVDGQPFSSSSHWTINDILQISFAIWRHGNMRRVMKGW